MQERKLGFYEKYIKRFLDIICSLLAIIVLCWLFAIIAIIVRIRMGTPIIFKQPRPGIIDITTGKEKIFEIYKFRTMTDDKDSNGLLLPDNERLPRFGRMLRATSLDELPELFNILKGDMSMVGPRPQLIRDLVFMTEKQRMRHSAKPGLSGLAQIKGRNAISWEEKFHWDLEYINNISFCVDARIIGVTIKKVLGKEESEYELELTDDYGDYLLRKGKITQSVYDDKNEYARQIEEKRKNS